MRNFAGPRHDAIVANDNAGGISDIERTQKAVGINPVRAAQVIFLNRTCFNGLFRVNKKSEFNVPHGLYKNPKILDSDNIMSVSQAFNIAEIIHGDFTVIKNKFTKPTFIYYDPPYRPLSSTSNFNAYAGDFNDTDQKRLAEFYKNMQGKNVFQMLSNSDPFSYSQDLFFDRLYSDSHIHRIEAKRIINANADKRGKIFELLITDYDTNWFMFFKFNAYYHFYNLDDYCLFVYGVF